MRLRVVCGLAVTIASFCPTNVFSSVDFPAFGRPMMEAKPERIEVVSNQQSATQQGFLHEFCELRIRLASAVTARCRCCLCEPAPRAHCSLQAPRNPTL